MSEPTWDQFEAMVNTPRPRLVGIVTITIRHPDGTQTEQQERPTDNRLWLASVMGNLARNESIVKMTLEWQER